MQPLIKLEQLSVHSDTEQLLKPLSLALYANQPITILGQTGSGKSLLAQAIMQLLPAELSVQGSVQVLREDQPKAIKSLWGKALIMLPQEPWRALDPLMPAYRHIAEVHECTGGKSEHQAFDLAMDALDELGLKASALKRPDQLSGGMAQRLAFSAATAAGANIIIADEPTKGLDNSRRNDIVAMLQEKAQGGALLTITHDIDVARQLDGEIIVMRQGEIVERGQAQQILDSPNHPYTKALIAASPKNWPNKHSKYPSSDATVLKCDSLSIGRASNTLAKEINITLHQGEVMGVVGDSGCGKSTLGDTLLGLIPPITGKITKCIAQQNPHQWLKLFQDPPAAFTDSVTLGTLLQDIVKLHSIDEKKISPLMAKLKLDAQLLDRHSTQVSGGELQRFAILRALLLEPVFLFADEPTSRLDPITAQEVTALLINLAKKQGCSILLVSHDPNLISKSCDTVITL